MASEERITCQHCGVRIFLETDDMINCGGMFEVWYSLDPGGKRSMCCSSAAYQAHAPRTDMQVDGIVDECRPQR